jgi:hypothetical protein
MPVLLNLSNPGGSRLENGVTYERVVGRVGPEIENGYPELWTYMKVRLEEGRRKGFFAATRNGFTGPSHLIFEKVRHVSDHRPCAHGRCDRCCLGEHLVCRAGCARGFQVQRNAIGTLRGQGHSYGQQLLV